MLLAGGVVLGCDAQFRVDAADVLVGADGRIAAVGPDLRAAATAQAAAGAPALRETLDAARTLPCGGAAVLPGFVQTHVHVCQTLLRNRADDLSLLEWLRRRVWPYEAALEAEDLAAAAQLACVELLLGGTTGILDMGTVRHHDAVFEALAASGIRAASGKCMMDRGEGVPGGLLESTEASLRESADLFDRWDGREGGRLRYAFAPRFALSCTAGLMEAVADEAARRRAILHTHAAENPAECELVRRDSGGRDNVDWLADLGVQGPRAVLAHCIHLTDREVRRMAESGTRASHCPSSNLKLGSGVARVPETAAAGVHWSLGADGAACNNRLDAFGELRLAALLARAKHGPAAFGAWDVLRMGTLDGARALRAEAEIGTLEPGKRADVIVLEESALAPGGDAATRILYGGGSRAVRDVIVDGQVLVRDRVPTRLDPAAVRAEAAEALPGLLFRAGLAS